MSEQLNLTIESLAKAIFDTETEAFPKACSPDEVFEEESSEIQKCYLKQARLLLERMMR